MDNMDEIMPEFDAKYDTRFEDARTGTEPSVSRETASSKFSVQISTTYPVLREFPHAGEGGNTYLTRLHGLESILKFYSSGMVRTEEVISKAKELSERLHDFILRIYEYGFDDNSKRWYVVREYAKYGSLKDLAGLNIPPDLAVKEINQGLTALHENNILHLNMKPSNILVREKHPPRLVFTDLNPASMAVPEKMPKTAPLKVKPLYASPELLTGIAGPEADYWALGMILLELLDGKHPFRDLDDRSAADIISTKGPSIPEHLSEDHRGLLRGLLTRDPGKRWGRREVGRWLEKDTDIPVHFSDPEKQGEGISEGHAVPYRFLNEEYSSIEELIPAFLKSGEAWESAREDLCQGRISKWLIGNADKKRASQVDSITEQFSRDPHLALVGLIYTFKKDLPFIIYGEQISIEGLHRCARKVLENKASGKDGSIIEILLNGKLVEYHREFMMLTSREDYELMSLFNAVRKAVSQKNDYNEKLGAACKMLDILVNPGAYTLPADKSDNVMRNLDFIAGNIDSLMTREKFTEIYCGITESLIIPDEMKARLTNDLSSGSPSEQLKMLEGLKGSSLLTKSEFDQLRDEYIIPVWLENDIFGKDASRYTSAVKLLRKLKGDGLLVREDAFLAYLKKYYRFIGHIIDKSKMVHQVRKEETFEQKWVRLLTNDIGRDDYIRVATYIKNNVALSMISRIEEITGKVSAQAAPSDFMNRITAYLQALRSCKVAWQDTDKQIVDEVHSVAFKKDTSMRFFDKLAGGAAGEFLRKLMNTLLGIDADEGTREMEGALAGFLGGMCVGIITTLIIVNLKPDVSFYGSVVLGLLLGLVNGSVLLAVLCAAAGFAGVYFLEQETLIEVIYSFAIAVIGAAKSGAYFGKRINRVPPYEDMLIKYDDRIQQVVNAVESAKEQ
jgi:serine/threonine protein kinase